MKSLYPIAFINFPDENGCDLFQPVITNNGLCHSFNPMPSLEILKPSYFTESFKEAFNDDLISNYILEYGTGAGKKHSIEFMLMGNTYRRQQDNGFTRFILGLSSGNCKERRN